MAATSNRSIQITAERHTLSQTAQCEMIVLFLAGVWPWPTGASANLLTDCAHQQEVRRVKGHGRGMEQ